MDFAVSLSVI